MLTQEYRSIIAFCKTIALKACSLFHIILILPLVGISQAKPKSAEAAGITLSLPWINNYNYYDYDLQKSSGKSGFVGLGAAAFYKHGKHKLSINFGLTGDLPVPIGPLDYGPEGTRTNIRSNIWEGIYHRTVIDRVSWIMGINYTRYRFALTSYVDTLPSYFIIDKTLGLTIGGEYRFRKNTSVALFYRPAVFSLHRKLYRHVISLDARFDINLWRRNSSRR